MKRLTFNTREEVIGFLKEYNFKYYIPRLEEIMDACPSNLKMYYIEITDTNKVNYCSVSKKENNAYSVNEVPFYVCNRAYDFPNEEEGEEHYKYFLEYKKLCSL